MATKAQKRGDKHRVVNTRDNKLVRNPNTNTPVDTGGHMTGSEAEKHARAIDRSKT